MTIRRGQEWGSRSELPRNIAVVGSDAEAAREIWSGSPVALAGGDLARTVGVVGSPPETGSDALPFRTEAPIDLMRVTVNGRTIPAIAHVIIRRPWYRGGWLRDRITVVMNSQFLGTLDLAPRGHPNDGRVEVTEVRSSMGVRQRLVARRRARTGSHLPHPDITTKSIDHIRLIASGFLVFVDGVCVGRSGEHAVVIDVEPDYGIVWF